MKRFVISPSPLPDIIVEANLAQEECNRLDIVGASDAVMNIACDRQDAAFRAVANWQATTLIEVIAKLQLAIPGGFDAVDWKHEEAASAFHASAMADALRLVEDVQAGRQV